MQSCRFPDTVVLPEVLPQRKDCVAQAPPTEPLCSAPDTSPYYHRGLFKVCQETQACSAAPLPVVDHHPPGFGEVVTEQQ